MTIAEKSKLTHAPKGMFYTEKKKYQADTRHVPRKKIVVYERFKKYSCLYQTTVTSHNRKCKVMFNRFGKFYPDNVGFTAVFMKKVHFSKVNVFFACTSNVCILQRTAAMYFWQCLLFRSQQYSTSFNSQEHFCSDVFLRLVLQCQVQKKGNN